MRLRLLAGVLGVVVAGCGYHETGIKVAPNSAANFRLFIQDGARDHPQNLTVINAASGTQERTVPLGAAAPDWSKLYTIDRQAGKSILRALDLRSGAVIHETALEGSYELPPVTISGMPGGLSPDGRWLAVVERNTSVQKSRFLVFDTSFSRPPKRVELDGTFQFDAISNDGGRLYLIEYLSAQPGWYRVRLYDLAVGRLAPQVIFDKTTRGAGAMSGTRVYGVPSPDGQWLFSLYINGPQGPFVHALSLGQNFAWCINLSATGKEDRNKQLLWSLAMRQDGSALYAANAALGVVTQIDMGNPPRIRRTATLDAAQAGFGSDRRYMAGKAALSPDGTTLFAPAGMGVLAIDTSTLRIRGHYLQDRTIDGLALSPDGAWLYAVSPDEGQLVQLNAATGAIAAEVGGAGATSSLLGIDAVR